MSRIRWYGPTIVLLLTVLIVMVLGPGVARQITYTQTQARVQFVRDSLTDSSFLAELSESFRKVSQVVEPSVVAIQALARENRFNRDATRRFFGPEMDEFLEQQQGQPRDGRYDKYQPPKTIGHGSGWVYRYQGDDSNDSHNYIITNNHVVRDADVIRVRFHDGAEYVATVVATDPRTDVAVLSVDAKNLVPASIAHRDVEQGDMVFAFGSPLSFDFSMSQGIVSATGRKLDIIRTPGGGYENFIQTDAMINPGNSGGPLTNIYGEVVGMNTAIAAGRGGPRTPGNGTFVGLGFAIPVDMVADIADRIIEDGTVRRGYLGISLPQKDLDSRMARTFGFKGKGVLVGEVRANEPAYIAGIQRGDIITRINDQPTPTIAILRGMVAGYRPGAKIRVELFRNGETQTINVVLEEFPDLPSASVVTPKRDDEPDDDSQGMSTLRKLGISGVQSFTEENAQRLGVDHFPAVIITAVRPKSVAAVEGLSRGMLITDVMGQTVSNVAELIEQIQRYDASAGIRVSVSERDPATRLFVTTFVILQLPSE